jgi:ribosomal protein S18 acetylase RimI-like enzyme
MKRLYVRSNHRGRGLGRRLVETVLAEAKYVGYRRVVLDTLANMEAAQALYRSLGFRPTQPYYDNPICGAVYLERSLA